MAAFRSTTSGLWSSALTWRKGNLQAITDQQGAHVFVIADDTLAPFFDVPGAKLVVVGSTGNDGVYTIVTADPVASDTVIEVSETIPSDVADGDLYLTGIPNGDDTVAIDDGDEITADYEVTQVGGNWLQSIEIGNDTFVGGSIIMDGGRIITQSGGMGISGEVTLSGFDSTLTPTHFDVLSNNATTLTLANCQFTVQCTADANSDFICVADDDTVMDDIKISGAASVWRWTGGTLMVVADEMGGFGNPTLIEFHDCTIDDMTIGISPLETHDCVFTGEIVNNTNWAMDRDEFTSTSTLAIQGDAHNIGGTATFRGTVSSNGNGHGIGDDTYTVYGSVSIGDGDAISGWWNLYGSLSVVDTSGSSATIHLQSSAAVFSSNVNVTYAGPTGINNIVGIGV